MSYEMLCTSWEHQERLKEMYMIKNDILNSMGMISGLICGVVSFTFEKQYMVYMKTILLAITLLICVIVFYLWIYRRHGHRTMIVCLMLYFFSIWGINIAALLTEYKGIGILYYSFLGTMQTFSLDADYTVLWRGIADVNMLISIPCALNLMIAPIIGGAVLLEILTGIFPQLKLFFRPKRRKFVFSGLNEASITLAEDLYRNENYKKIFFWDRSYDKKFHLCPLLVFTDAYQDTESEKQSELFDRAEDLGAICVKTDLLHLSLSRSKSVYYFLIDEDEQKNVAAIAGLLSGDGKGRPLWPVGEEVSENEEMKREREKNNKDEENRWQEARFRDEKKEKWLRRSISRLINWSDKLEVKSGNSVNMTLDDEIIEIDEIIKKIKNIGNLIDESKDVNNRCLENWLEDFRNSSKQLKEKCLRSRNDQLERAGEMFPDFSKEPGPVIEEVTKDPLTKVFVFCQSDTAVSLIGDLKDENGNKKNLMIRPIRDYMHTAVMLMNDTPLFLPLLKDEMTTSVCQMPSFKVETEKIPGTDLDRTGGIIPDRKKCLHVTIIGSGAIAAEVFKAVFWCGQMAGIQLYIHILSKGAGEMQKKLHNSCPELFSGCMDWERILKIYPHEPDSNLFNVPYAIVDGFDQDADAEDIASYVSNDNCVSNDDLIEKTDYYVVALGDDARNIAVTRMLASEISRRALNKEEYVERHPVIAPVIFDSKLASAVRKIQPERYMPYQIPFGMVDQRYGCRNVFLSDFTDSALKGGKIYNRKTELTRQKDEYSWWANLVRAIHAPYKLFALGCITGIVLDSYYTSAMEEKEQKTVDIGRFRGNLTYNYLENDNDKEKWLLSFAWMEHRRWNAFLRTQGFSHATEVQHKNLFNMNNREKQHKDIKDSKLHNCLVEGSMRGNKMPVSKPAFDSQYAVYDALDMESFKAYEMNCARDWDKWALEDLKQNEYKQWDEYKNDPEAKKLMGMLSETIAKDLEK